MNIKLLVEVSLIIIGVSMWNQLSRIVSSVTGKNSMPKTMGSLGYQFSKSEKLPVFFLSHGGPNFADRKDGFGSDVGAWDKTRQIGQYIKKTLKPDFIICVSAHWQSEVSDVIEITVPKQRFEFDRKSKPIVEDENELIYDFYGFPQSFYDTQFHTVGCYEIASEIEATLKEGGFRTQLAPRGIDHGVWVPLRVAFGETNTLDTGKLDIDVPLIQVSLTSSSLMPVHFKLGQLLAKYRSYNGVIICSGMSVHNLRDMGRAMYMGGRAMPYVEPFNKVLTSVLSSASKGELLQELLKIETNATWKELYRKSHPTTEHFLPLVVAAGASDGDSCTELYSASSVSLGWNIYSWGNSEI